MADNSFEFFPPKSAEGKAKLRDTWHELAKLKPRFFSCTYGAGGSTRDGTLETVMEIRRADVEHGLERAFARGAAGAIGAGKEARLQFGELLPRRAQLFLPLRGLRREELEAESPSVH